VVALIEPRDVGVADMLRLTDPGFVGLVTCCNAMSTLWFAATATGELNATLCPIVVVKVMGLPFIDPPVIVPAFVSPGRVIEITVLVVTAQPARTGHRCHYDIVAWRTDSVPSQRNRDGRPS